MAETVLVTGATGFVGSHIAEAFVEAGWRVRCTVRATSSPRWLEPLNVERVELDLRRPGDPARALEGVGTVVHAAGVTTAPDPRLYRAVNVEGTARLAAAAAGAGVRRFVFVSSLAARGPDGSDGPVSPYGRSKREAEGLLRGMGGPPEVVVLRPAGVYGPRDRDMVRLFRMAARGWLAVPGNDARLQPVYATDVARAALRAAANGRGPGFGPHPVAERGRYRWEEVRAAFAASLGRPVRLLRLPGWVYEAAGAAGEALGRVTGRPPAFDRRRARDLARYAWTCDPRETERALGWRAEVDLPGGLERTLRWYRSAGWVGRG